MESREIPTLYLTYDFLPNPYYVPELRPQTGNDKPVSDMVKDCKAISGIYGEAHRYAGVSDSQLSERGQKSVSDFRGCTGGKHRSVTVANALYETLEKLPYTVRLYHRDIGKDRIVKGE